MHVLADSRRSNFFYLICILNLKLFHWRTNGNRVILAKFSNCFNENKSFIYFILSLIFHHLLSPPSTPDDEIALFIILSPVELQGNERGCGGGWLAPRKFLNWIWKFRQKRACVPSKNRNYGNNTNVSLFQEKLFILRNFSICGLE